MSLSPGPSAMGGRGRSRWRPSLLTVAVLVLAVAAVLFTEWRLWQGIDLADESYYVAVPYHYAQGARPFVDEIGVLQLPGMLVYPAFKPFVALQHGHADGIIMYGRHLYFLMMLVTAAAVFFAMRRHMRWQYALLVALPCLTLVLIERPQLSYNSLGAAFLTLAASCGLLGILPPRVGSADATADDQTPKTPAASAGGEGRPLRALGWLAVAGLASGLAGFGFPTLWAIAPLYAACLAATVFSCKGTCDSLGSSRRRRVLSALAAYCSGMLVVLIVEGGLLLWSGWSNVMTSLRLSLVGARALDQVGGWPKMVKVLDSLASFIWTGRLFLAAALLLYLLFRYRPNLARVLLVLVPVPLYFASRTFADASGYAIVLVLCAPYLYLFVPRPFQAAARVLLLWVTLPAVAAGLLTAWTSADGYTHFPVGAYPGLMVSGALLVLAVAHGWHELLASRGYDRLSSPAIAVLAVSAALVCLTVLFQFQFITRGVPYSQLTAWVSSGPYWGAHTTPQRKAYLEQLDRDLSRYGSPSDRLLIYSDFPGGYLFWPYRTASNAVWVSGGIANRLPGYLTDWIQREHSTPDLILRMAHPDSLTDREYLDRFGLGLGYKIECRRHGYVLLRRPSAGSATRTFGAGS